MANRRTSKIKRRRRLLPVCQNTDAVRQPCEWTISWAALFKIIAASALVGIAWQLGRLAALVFLALLVSLALWKIVQACTRRGLPKSVGITISATLVVGLIVALAVFVLPAIGKQATALVSHLPELQKQATSRLPDGPIRDAVNQLMDSASFSNPQPLISQLATWGTVLLTSLSEFLIVMVIAIYFLVDGERIHRWLVAFLPQHHRTKVRDATPEIVEIVSRYVSGQFVTSLLCGGFAFLVLYFLRVPNAALLAVLAGVFDILPVIGFFLFIIPAVAVAFTVSPAAAGLAALLYGGYHLLENYFIVPKVYGNQLKLSTLTVLLSCLAGWLLAGVLGAIAILPVIASYPIIERLWLEPLLEPDTVPKHSAAEKETT